MTTPKCVGCPFRRDCPDCPWSGEIPAAATVSDARTGVADARIALLAHARETPAPIGVGRGRGPTDVESSNMDITPETPPRGKNRGGI